MILTDSEKRINADYSKIWLLSLKIWVFEGIISIRFSNFKDTLDKKIFSLILINKEKKKKEDKKELEKKVYMYIEQANVWYGIYHMFEIFGWGYPFW